MISYYSGTPGSGKSLHVAMQIYDWIQRGKNVIAFQSTSSTQRKTAKTTYIPILSVLNFVTI